MKKKGEPVVMPGGSAEPEKEKRRQNVRLENRKIKKEIQMGQAEPAHHSLSRNDFLQRSHWVGVEEIKPRKPRPTKKHIRIDPTRREETTEKVRGSTSQPSEKRELKTRGVGM